MSGRNAGDGRQVEHLPLPWGDRPVFPETAVRQAGREPAPPIRWRYNRRAKRGVV